MIDTRTTGYPIHFAAAPEVGTQITYWGGHVASLISVSTYRKRDGSVVPLLEWAFDDGRVGTSGLRGKSMNWRNAQEAQKWTP